MTLLTASLLTVSVGLFWGSGGAVLSSATRARFSFPLFMALYALLAAAGSWAALVRWDHVDSLGTTRLPSLAGVLLGAALAIVASRLTMEKAMRSGHHGSVWTINQTSCVIPFLFSLLVWQEPLSWQRLVGVVLIGASIGCMGLARAPGSAGREAPGAGWLVYALLSFAAGGVQQICMTLPSKWAGWSDAARFRPALFFTAQCLLYGVAALIQHRRRPPSERADRRSLAAHAVLLATIAVVSHAIFFAAVDGLSALASAGIAFPLAIGTSIVTFAVYSMFVLREPAGMGRLSGIVLGCAGVALLSV